MTLTNKCPYCGSVVQRKFKWPEDDDYFSAMYACGTEKMYKEFFRSNMCYEAEISWLKGMTRTKEYDCKRTN